MLNRARTLARFFKISKDAEDTRDVLEELIETEEPTSASLNPLEKQLFLNVLNFRKLTAADVMTPRAEIVGLSEAASFEETVQTISTAKRTIFPVYHEMLDEVIGLVRAKDLLPLLGNAKTFHLRTILYPVSFIAPNMRLLELLVQLRTSGSPMVMVVDEFGGVDGLITLRDVVCELVGDIYEEGCIPPLVRRSDGLYMADARLPIEECEKTLGVPLLVPLESEDTAPPEVDTIGGLATILAGHIPQKGELLTHPAGLQFEILEADPRHVVRLGIKVLPAS
ncbi:MAG: CBS domain-containing protein [Holosporales bacterium]|jgi:CBS domain containing-hemolysin-like protein|nr:CBS domain-containing protein [Holosporales bacterium]